MQATMAWDARQERLGERQSEVNRKTRGNDFAGEARVMFFATCRELGDHFDHCSISPFLRLSLAAGGQRVMFDGHAGSKLPRRDGQVATGPTKPPAGLAHLSASA